MEARWRYLNFFDDGEDIIQERKPRFNSLNLFAVPNRTTSAMCPFTPLGRFAITGWFRAL
ncbi:MAG: hypothetical protein DI568_07715 [Sphingomonas sp.]|nr:MAG: hypothetical protein DI568_07715 [Sphingomonas sp.]